MPIPKPDTRDPLYRMQPERWLESMLRRDISQIDAHLDPAHVYTHGARVRRVRSRHARPARRRQRWPPRRDRAQSRRGSAPCPPGPRLLGARALASPAEPRPQLRSRRVSAPRATSAGSASRKARRACNLVARRCASNPATEIVLRYLSPRVDWVLVALDERWRRQIKVVWRKRSGDKI